MSKIICDICGSSYSDSETHCPICGTAKSDSVKPVVETTEQEQPGRGGKFSQPSAKKTTPARPSEREKRPASRKQDGPSGTAMIAIVAVLLLAIIAVVIFIVARAVDKPGNGTTASTTEGTVPEVPCTSIQLETELTNNTLTFTLATDSAQLSVLKQPEDTTDELVYTSSDPKVVYVGTDGRVTPIAPGTAQITITCGTADPIVVTVESKIPDPNAPTLELERTDLTLSDKNGTTYDMYLLVVNREKFDKDLFVVTSADPEIVQVDGTKVIAQRANSQVEVTISYGDQSVTCLVRVGTITQTEYKLDTGWQSGSAVQVSLVLGEEGKESFVLKLVDKEGKTIPLAEKDWVFSTDFPKCCKKTYGEDGSVTITAKAVTSTLVNGQYVLVKVSYKGVTYQCKIFVSAAEA